jgi:hypothetical protein
MVDPMDRDIVGCVSEREFSVLCAFANFGDSFSHDVFDGAVVEISFFRPLHVAAFKFFDEIDILVGFVENGLDHGQHTELGLLLPFSDQVVLFAAV